MKSVKRFLRQFASGDNVVQCANVCSGDICGGSIQKVGGLSVRTANDVVTIKGNVEKVIVNGELVFLRGEKR